MNSCMEWDLVLLPWRQGGGRCMLCTRSLDTWRRKLHRRGKRSSECEPTPPFIHLHPSPFGYTPLPFPLRAALGEGRVRKLAEELKVDFTFLDRSGLDKLCGNRPHQVLG